LIRSLVGSLLLAALLCGSAEAQAPDTVPGVPLAAREIMRGTVLTDQDVTYPAGVERDGTGAPVGWVARRVIAAGEPLREPAVAQPDLVHVGDVVQAVFSAGGLEIRLIGRAMGAARAGEMVMVRVDMHRRFEGVVVGPRLVNIDIPDRSRT
jgi:flagella basal body P-ring formation protein FlgA